MSGPVRETLAPGRWERSRSTTPSATASCQPTMTPLQPRSLPSSCTPTPPSSTVTPASIQTKPPANPGWRSARCSSHARRSQATGGPDRRTDCCACSKPAPSCSDEAIDVIVRHQPRKASPLSFLPIFVLGGAYSRAADNATAFGGSRDIKYVVNISAACPTPELFEADRAWVRAFWSDLVQHASGVGSYVNFMSEYDENRVRAALRSREVRAFGADQGGLRSQQPLPPQRQHSPSLASQLSRAVARP